MDSNQKRSAISLARFGTLWMSTGMWEKEFVDAAKSFASSVSAADAPKRKYTVADIEKPVQVSPVWFTIRCGAYGWYNVDGWQIGGGSIQSKVAADVIYAGLVATGNVPEVGE